MGDLAHARRDVPRPAIDRGGCAKRPDVCVVFRRARRNDLPEAEAAGDLDGKAADATGATSNKKRVFPPEPKIVMECPPCRPPGARGRRSKNPGHRRMCDQRACAVDREFRQAAMRAEHVPVVENAVADAPALHAREHLVDLAKTLGIDDAGLMAWRNLLDMGRVEDILDGANAIIASRCCQISGRFEDFWEGTA